MPASIWNIRVGYMKKGRNSIPPGKEFLVRGYSLRTAMRGVWVFDIDPW